MCSAMTWGRLATDIDKGGLMIYIIQRYKGEAKDGRAETKVYYC